MRILHVINCFARSGGAEKFVFDLAMAQKRDGEDVEILSLISPDETDCDFMNMATSVSVPVRCLHHGKLISFVMLIKLWRYFKDNRYDVVHAHLFPSFYYCALFKRHLRCLCFTEHSTSNRRRSWLFRGIDKYIYNRLDCTICISAEVKNKLVEHVGPVCTAIVPNGVSLHECSSAIPYERKELLGLDNVHVILMVSRFIESKDHLTLFDSLKYLPDNVHVVCVGAGPTEFERKRYCEVHGLSNRVHFLGLRKDVGRIIKTADVVVLSTAYEGFSISMLEAMASGRPFIASSVPGIVDLVQDYTELFPYGDSKRLAEIVNELLANPSYYDQIVGRNLTFAAQYDIESIKDQYSMVYKKYFIAP